MVIVIAIPLGFMLVRQIISPLEDVAQAMRRFSTGELDVRSAIRRRDEIGRLAETFNKMADEHQKAHENLTRFNTELEDRVARRTLQLRELASRDSLTGLYNRRHFNELLQTRLAEALRYNSELTCVMIDLDNFKTVNDVFGHQVGDDLLMIASSAVKQELRASDVAARFGGDEFIILLPQTDVQQAHVLVNRIAERFRRECAVRCPRVPIGMSIGAASLRSLRQLDATGLVRAADDALYRAKAAGKNCIVSSAAPVAAV
jgi:diguanylate cyclase (GGDEF)-like protein